MSRYRLIKTNDALANPHWLEASTFNWRVPAELRDTLLPKLVSGELRVTDAERFVGATA